jgi:Lrp/AsnC family leucine-responsive transcriptional regulator
MPERYARVRSASIPVFPRLCAIILRVDEVDQQILTLLVEDGRRTYDDIGSRVNLSAPSVKRRVDRLRAEGAIEGFTMVAGPGAMGWHTEALVELFYRPGTTLDDVAETLRGHPEVVEAWSVTGDADAIARVRTEDNATLERLIMDLQRAGEVVRTRSQVVLSRLVGRPTRGLAQGVAGRDRLAARVASQARK